MLSPYEKSALDEIADQIRASFSEAAPLREALAYNQDFSVYKNSPVDYVKDVLGMSLWEKQIEIALAVQNYKKVLVKSGHLVGKSSSAAALANWWFDTNDPSICLTTAPTEAQVNDILWKEVRSQRKGRFGLLPKAPRMESSPNHFAVGYTAKEATAFQGKHEQRVFVIFDEGNGVSSEFWEAAKTMVNSDNDRWLVLCNPVSLSGPDYIEELSGNWHVISISCFDHPNIKAQIQGLPAVIKGAVDISYINDAFKDWTTPIHPEDKKATDLEWPPESGKWFRPGPIFEARVLGQRPSSQTDSLWSDALIKYCESTEYPLQKGIMPEIGVDVARYGTSYSTLYVRWGKSIVEGQRHQGIDTSWLAATAKTLADKWAKEAGMPESNHLLPVKIDISGGFGGGIVDQRGDYRFIGINSSWKAVREDKYHNRRSELWFTSATMASDSHIEWSRLPQSQKLLLRRQFLPVKYKGDERGRFMVEKKDDMIKRLSFSPDDADAVNLACTSIWQPRPNKSKKSEFLDRYRNKGFYNESRERAWMLPI